MPYKDPDKQKESDRIRQMRYREKNKNNPKYKARRKIEQRKNWEKYKEKYKEKHRVWHMKNKEKQNKVNREYYHKNKEVFNEKRKAQNKIRRKTDDNFLITSRLRCLLYNSLKLYADGKRFSSSKYGIDFNKICKKLGPCPSKKRSDYHIDHILPVSSFNLRDPNEVKKAFAPKNLQWLPAKENIKKSNKLT